MSASKPCSLRSETVDEEVRREYRVVKRHRFQEELRISWEKCPDYLDQDTFAAFRRRSGLARDVCNKLTILYWAFDSQGQDNTGQRTCTGYGCPSGAIAKEWFRHNYPPRLDFGYYAAKSFQVGESGPSTISDLLHTHRAVCSTTTRVIEQERVNERGTVFEETGAKNHELFPLCRALLVVLDQSISKSELTEFSVPKSTFGDTYSLDQFARKQTLLLVRTGDESELSAPIDFSEVATEALPLRRPDITVESGVDAVRLTVATAISFLYKIQRREETARPDDYHNPTPDKTRNIGLLMKASRGKETWYPASEDEWVSAVYDTSRWEHFEEHWLQSAQERVRKREAGEKDWDDLIGEDCWTRRWV